MTARRWVALAVLVGVAVLVDPRTPTNYSVPKFAVLAVGVGVLVAGTVAQWAFGGRAPRWATGLHRPVLLLVAWAGVSTAAGVNPRYSVLGDYLTLDGLVTTVLFAGLFLAVADVVRARDLKTVATAVYLAAGGPVVVYGLLQLHDQVTDWGGRWNVLNPSGPSDDGWIYSTFGNPNHLGGFLALLVPLGLVLVVVHRRWWVRALVGAIGVAAVVELAYTTSRGAWLGALAGVGVLAVVVAPDLRRRPRLVAGLAAGLLAAGIVGAAVLGPGAAGRQFLSIFDPDGRTTVERTEFWGAAWRMAADRPLVGVGPDTYLLLFNRYQSDRYAAEFGPGHAVNGPHSIFFAHLAGGGFPQLALFVVVLVMAARQGREALRRLGDRGPPATRLLFAGVGAATVAIVVHSAFDVQELFLSVWVWALLGVVTGAAADVGVRAAWHPVADPTGATVLPPARPGVPRRMVGVPTVLAGVAFAVAASWLAVNLYRADVDAGRGDDRLSVAYNAAVNGELDRALAEGAAASRRYDRAMALYPWAARYPAARAIFELSIGEELMRSDDPAHRREGLVYLERARRHARRTVELTPQSGPALSGYAGVLEAVTDAAAPTLDYSAEIPGVVARAMEANPHDRTLFQMLARAQLARRPTPGP